MAHLKREQIREADDLQTEEVKVPEWCACDAKGGEGCECSVLVRALSGKERDAYEDSLRRIVGDKVIPDATNMRAKLVVRVVVDDDGEMMFSESDINWVGSKSAAALDRIYDKATNLSGIGEDDVEQAVGNSGAALSGASTSSSLNGSAAPSPSSSPESAPAS